MSRSELLQRFRACHRYKRAKSWQKIFIHPTRMLANQLRCRGWGAAPIGSLRTVAAFHLPEFTVVAGEGVSREIECYGIFEDELTEAFLRLIKPGQVVVDIGMHLGYYATLFARLVTEQGEVHAFEPTPSTREIARRNVERFPQVVVHPEAVWSNATTLSFRDYGTVWMAFNSYTKAKTNEVPEPKMFSVQTTTLDLLRSSSTRPIALVKIDAESAEREILTGAKKLLDSDQPLVSVEVGDSEGTPGSRPLVEFLQAQNYQPWEFREGCFGRHQLRAVYDYDNLIFAPTSRDLSNL